MVEMVAGTQKVIPIEQGLKLRNGMFSQKVIPIEQGLKRVVRRQFAAHILQTQKVIPIEQGLKLAPPPRTFQPRRSLRRSFQ